MLHGKVVEKAKRTVHFDDFRTFQLLLAKSYEYLYRNFSSFKQETRVKIALRLIEKHVDIGLAKVLSESKGEKHLHLTTIQLSDKKSEELVANLFNKRAITNEPVNRIECKAESN